MTAKRIGVGVIGTGFGTRVLAPAFAAAPGAELRAVCSQNPERARAAAKQLGVGFATDDYRALAARPDVDLVCIATPPAQHHAMVMAALDAAKHVFCEKPFALDLAQAREMLAAARARGVLHFLDFEFRTYPARRELARRIRAGELGRIQQVEIAAMVDGRAFPVMNVHNWWHRRETAGGWLGAMGTHLIDALRDWVGEIIEVSAHLETARKMLAPAGGGAPLEVTVDDGFHLLLRGESGVLCSISSSSFPRHSPGQRVEMYGTESSALILGDRELSVARADGGWQRVTLEEPASSGDAHPSRGPLGTWAGEVIAAIQTGKQIAPSFEDGLRCQAVVDAAHRSHAQSGHWVAVEHD
jgi:predicted dehydrogenase